ncbi:hypothetical protein AX14_003022 [Amanita brunnescens Koide BX004]|nr:hypothetical protein AX14_003022 [Amanita brunnescens Koide BX004]
MPTTKDASLPEIQDVKTEPEAPLHWIWTLVAMIFTFGIPAFHASLATITSGTMIDLKAVVPAWKGVRHLDTVLLATFLTASFKESAQVNPVYWFLVTCSLLQALMGLVCSTILIIIFLGGHNEYKYSSANEDHLRLLCWSLWDHFSLPAISTVWSILMFMIALIVDALWSNEARNYSGQDHLDTYFTAAKVALFLVLCFTAARFGIFMFQLRRISQALYQAARAESA